MITRRLREWPRATVAVSVLALGLILLGVLVASAGSGGAAHAASKPPATHPTASGSATGSSPSAARATITRLQASLKHESDQLAAAHGELVASQAATRCWQGKAHHPRKEHAVQCPQGS